MFGEFIAEYGTAILYAVITAIAGYIGTGIKKLYQKYIDDKTKEKVAITVVKAVKQLYNDLDGEEKLEKAIEYISEMLSEKGINASELEIRMLIESAVSEIKEKVTESEEMK